MAFNKQLLDIIACPVCKGNLELDEQQQQLICKHDKLAYNIDEGIPVLIEEKAHKID
ncbi:Trm112 family protein [Paraferrimonas sp. SM1919]|uniref:Trm112 family protein n=1 Tax=Paraferrimonas sp. SM1919 TaxID=2662263 RepID=UPI0013D5E82C|nr:Trm112 family protein [Paraferrimonas sp. SM1919]